jgi:hypothetical protein
MPINNPFRPLIFLAFEKNYFLMSLSMVLIILGTDTIPEQEGRDKKE